MSGSEPRPNFQFGVKHLKVVTSVDESGAIPLVAGARSKHNCATITHKLNPIIDVGSWDYAAGSRAIPVPAHSMPVQPCWASH